MPIPLVNLVELQQAVTLLDQVASPSFVDRALREAGINRKTLEADPSFLPYVIEAVVVESVARSVGDPHLGIKLGKLFDYSAYRSFAAYVLGAPDLGSAIIRGQQAMPLIHPGSTIVLERRENHLIVGRSSDIQSVVGHRHLDEAAVFVIGKVIQHFLGPDWRSDWIEMTGDGFGNGSTLEDIAHSPVRTNKPMPAVVVRLDDLSAPNPSLPPPEEAITLAELPSLMGVTVPKTMEDVIRHLFQTQLVTGDLSVDSVARRLSLGRRTLQRILESEGTSFREVRERFLLKRACELLSQTDFAIDEIARSLGYTEPNNFRRFFRRSAGISPTEYRIAMTDHTRVDGTKRQ